jgi:polyvinyl alcohol dehydrogenase (cytochrome)
MLTQRVDGKDVLVAGNKDGMVYAVDPDDNGKVLWGRRVGKGGEEGGIEYGMATDGRQVYAPTADIDFETGASDGALSAVDLMTGRVTWRTPTPKDGCAGKGNACNNALVSPPLVVGDIVIAGGLDGVLRGYDKHNGKVLWSYDAVRAFAGVNGLEGKGGAFGMGGMVLAGNMLYISSGNGIANTGLPGNVLLAFEVGDVIKRRAH